MTSRYGLVATDHRGNGAVAICWPIDLRTECVVVGCGVRDVLVVQAPREGDSL